MRSVLTLLANRVESGIELPEDLEPLKDLEWLPAREDDEQWYEPGELYASYQNYLFESQAEFIDCPHALEQACNELFKQLGLNLVPTPNLVVKHLLQCIADGVAANNRIYAFLD